MNRLTGEVELTGDVLTVSGDKGTTEIHLRDVGDARFVASRTMPERSALELDLYDGTSYSVTVDLEKGPEIYAAVLKGEAPSQDQEDEV